MRHVTAFLQHLRQLKDQTGGLEPEVHYARLDAVLNTLSLTQQKLTYRQLGRVLGVFSAKLAAMLGRRMEDDQANGVALSSALIINRNTEISSAGFFDQARALGYRFADERAFWQEQVEGCFAAFVEVKIGMALNTGLSDEEQEIAERADQAVVGAMIQAGVLDRPVWSAETVNGRRMIRLRTARRIILDMTDAEFAESTEATLAAQVRAALQA